MRVARHGHAASIENARKQHHASGYRKVRPQRTSGEVFRSRRAALSWSRRRFQAPAMDAVLLIHHIIQADPLRWHILGVVRALRLPDCWIGAGFVRNAVWDHLHRRSRSPLDGDVDVVWHDPWRADPIEDKRHEAALRAAEPSIPWSVKNQARMHARNGDASYASSTDAMRYWPETATAVAVRRTDEEGCEVAAPFGLDDLLSLVVRPTPRFAREERHIYEEHLRTKQWAASWPLLKVAEA